MQTTTSNAPYHAEAHIKAPSDASVEATTGALCAVSYISKSTWQVGFKGGVVCNAEARNSASADSVAWQRKGVLLRVVKSQGPMEHTLTDLVALAKVLYQEEQKAFHAAMEEDTDRSAGQLCTEMLDR